MSPWPSHVLAKGKILVSPLRGGSVASGPHGVLLLSEVLGRSTGSQRCGGGGWEVGGSEQVPPWFPSLSLGLRPGAEARGSRLPK